MNRSFLIQSALLLITAMFFIPFLGDVHLFDWDEINFAEIAREMIETNDYLNVQIAYQPFWEKPPLFIWFQVVSMKIFGINEFAARFPNAICGILTILILFRIGKRVFSEKFGIIWALSYAGSILPFFYFKSGIIDPWFNLFIMGSLVLFIEFQFTDRFRWVYISLSGAVLGLAVITKGPVALLIFALSLFIYWLFTKDKWFFNVGHIALFLLSFLIAGGSWFMLQILNGRWDVVYDFIVYQIRLFQTKDAGHGGFPFYHVVVLLIGVFPASIFAFKGFFAFHNQTDKQKSIHRLFFVLFWVVLILFSIVKTKIIHYSSLCYFPLTFMAAQGLNEIMENRKKFNLSLKIIMLFITLIYCSLLILIVYGGMNADKIINSGFIKDEVVNSMLQAKVNWTGIEIVPAIMILLAISIFLFYYKSISMKSVRFLYISMMLFSFSLMVIMLPKIEPYTQGAAIEFFKKLENKDVYVHTLGYKSFAHLFYAKTKPLVNPKASERGWCANGEIDKPAYLAVKINEKETYRNAYPLLIWLYDKNGYSFFYREPLKQTNNDK